MNETKLELRQPFTSTLSQLSLHTLSQRPQRGQVSSQQVNCSNPLITLNSWANIMHIMHPYGPCTSLIPPIHGLSCIALLTFVLIEFFMFYTVYADPSVMEKHGPRQRVHYPEQAVAEYLQQGAGLRSVLNATGWWRLIFNLIVVHLENHNSRHFKSISVGLLLTHNTLVSLNTSPLVSDGSVVS